MSARPDKPRTVRPRRETQSAQKPIMAVTDTQIMLERTGEVYPISTLPALITSEPSSIIACHNAGVLLNHLDRIFDDNPRWQFRVNPVEKEVYAPNRQRTNVTIRANVVSFLGFQRAQGHSESKYHYPVDPLMLCRKTASEIVEGAPDSLSALFEWGKDLRTWLVENEIPLKPTSGGIASQLLKDRRFYPEPRRKVPRATNDKARQRLPGNYYRLAHAKPRQFYTAYYLDQSSAHHNCAKDLSLPDSDSLYARGHFLNPDDSRIWAHAGSLLFDRTLRMFGLFKLKLDVPSINPDRFPPPFLDNKGVQIAYVYSNELDLLDLFNVRIVGIVAAWASPTLDTGLPKYARWALRQNAQSVTARRNWLKPTLLSAYGVLASRPRQLRFAFKRAKGGEDTMLPVGSGRIKARVKSIGGDAEPGIVHAVQRGMIEAETRKRTLACARYFSEYGCRVLALYADSVFLDAGVHAGNGGLLPFIPDGWRLVSILHALQFLNPVQFTSREMTKLPGVVQREDGERVARHTLIKSLQTRKENHAGRNRGTVRKGIRSRGTEAGTIQGKRGST